ncbi:MAG: hypothetical protein QXO21_05155, partial [Candidatus Anstonellales archaeon]
MAEISIILNAKDNGAISNINNLKNALNNLKTSISDIAIGIGAYNIFGRIFSGMKSAFEELLISSTMLSARAETLGIALETIGKNAGYSKREIYDFTEIVKSQGITIESARESMARMIQANISLSEASKLARIAQDAAVIGNINSSQAFEKLIYGIQTAQTEVLRTIGINVSFEASYANLAKSLGKTREELTENEKTQARLNAVLEQGQKIAGVYEQAMTTVGKQITSLPRYWEEFKNTLGETFKPSLSIIISGITQGLKDLKIHLEQNKGAINQLSFALAEISNFFVNFGIKTIKGFGITLNELLTIIRFAKDNFTTLTLSITGFIAIMNISKIISFTTNLSSLLSILPTLENNFKIAATAITAFNLSLLTNPITIAITAIAAGIAIIGKSAWDAYKAIEALRESENNYGVVLENLRKKTQHLGISFSDAAEFNKKLNEGLKNGTIVVDEHGKLITAAEKAQIEKNKADEIAKKIAEEKKIQLEKEQKALRAISEELKKYSKAISDLGKESLRFAEKDFSDKLKKQSDFFQENKTAISEIQKPLNDYLFIISNIYNEQIKGQTNIYEIMKKINIGQKDQIEQQIKIKETEKNQLEERLKAWLTFYSHLGDMHKSAIEEIKKKQEELENIKKEGQKFGEELYKKYFPEEEEKSAYEKYFYDLEQIDKKITEALELTADKRIKALEEVRKSIMEMPLEIKEGDEIIFSNIKIYDDLLERYTKIQNEIENTKNSEITALQSAKEQFEIAMKESEIAINTLKKQILELDDLIISFSRKIIITAEDNATAVVQKIKNELDKLTDKQITIST